MTTTTPLGLHSSVNTQRAKLNEALYRPMRRLADAFRLHLSDRAALEKILQDDIRAVPYCKYLYVLGCTGSANHR
ncbi:MAG: hypothetical protein ACYCY3_05150 [Halothiobacillus sp.]